MNLYAPLMRFRRQPRLAYAVVFVVFFLFLLVALAVTGLVLSQRDLNNRLATEVQGFDDFARDMSGTLNALLTRPSAAPCSEAFLQWMRRVAFLPDGIHEIIYVAEEKMRCSVSVGAIDPPIPIGASDYDAGPGGHVRVWLDRDLGMLGFPGIVGSFLKIDDFVLVVPSLSLAVLPPPWMNYEVVSLSEAGTGWHRLGDYGVYSALTGISDNRQIERHFAPGLSAVGCSWTNATCIAILTPLSELVTGHPATIAGGVALAALLAGLLTRLTRGFLENSWSLPERFRRQLSVETIVCHYQPLLDVHKDQFCGVEVLARWSDDDGSLIYPDAILPIVDRRGLHRPFTRHVVDRAYKELSKLAGGPQPLKVHFNIFPAEFAVAAMLDLFEDFLADKSRFTVVIELVESDALPIERTREAISQLLDAGILTFIDDFGEGYSSIGYLASLGTHGVKLDRSFGLAREGSLMDAMLASAIEMVAKTGQVLVVEGVETAARLVSLKSNRNVSIAQGYFISRPLDIEALETLFGRHGFRWNAEAA